MHLKQLDGKALLSKTVSLVAEERRITMELIEHLREIERRMLFCELGYGSLFDFCVRHLGLSEGSAHRRISAMRLLRDVPEAKAPLAEGSLSLTNASKLHAVFQSSKRLKCELKKEEKLEVLEQVTGLTQKECETRLFDVLPAAMKETTKEKERAISTDAVEIKVVLGMELHEKLQELKALLSHRIPTGSTLETLEYLIDKELADLKKKKGLMPKNTASKLESTSTPGQKETSRSSTDAAPDESEMSEAEKERFIWRRAKGRCEISGCNSRFQLEKDHISPRALGGSDELSNFRLVCKAHNLYFARRYLSKMR